MRPPGDRIGTDRDGFGDHLGDPDHNRGPSRLAGPRGQGNRLLFSRAASR